MKKTTPTRWITTRLVQQWDGEKYVTIEEQGYWYDGPLSLAHEAVNLDQQAFRFYDSTDTAVDAQDTDPTTLAVDTDYQFCVRVSNTSNDSSANNNDYTLQYNHAGNGWVNVGVTDGGGIKVATATAGLTDDATYTPDRLTGAVDSRLNGYEETSASMPTITLGANTYAEIIFGFRVDSALVVNNDNIDFRVCQDASATLLDNYAVTPSITVSEATDIPVDDFPTPLRYDLTGLAPTALVSITAQPDQGSLTLTGSAPQRARKLSLGGFEPTVSVSELVNKTPDAGSLSLTGEAPAAGQSFVIAVPTGSLEITGSAPVVTFEWVAAPAQLSLLLTGEIPTVDATANHIRAPPNESLALTGLTPVVTGSISSTPDNTALTLTGLSPTLLGDNWQIEPAPGSLTLTGAAPQRARKLDLTGLAPTINIEEIAQPGTKALTLSGAVPAVLAGDNRIAQPGVDALAITGEIPAVVYDWVITPDAGSLGLTGETPSLGLEFIIEPATQSLALSGESPSIGFDWVIGPAQGSLSLTGEAPTAVSGDNRVAQPGVGSLTASGEIPAIGFDWTVGPDAGTLNISASVPIALSGGDVAEDPASGSLTLTGYAPSILGVDLDVLVATGSLSLTGNQPYRPWHVRLTGYGPAVINGPFVSPGEVDLSLTGYAPTAGIGVEGVASPATASLGITGYSPATTIFIGSPDASLEITGYVPTFSFNTLVTKSPGAGSLALTGYAPEIDSQALGADPATGSLALSGLAPTRFVESFVTPGAGSLNLTGQDVSFTFGFYWETFPGTESLAITGLAPSVEQSNIRYPATGSLAVTGFQPTIGFDWVVGPDAGSIGVSGRIPSVLDANAVGPGEGSIVLSGYAPEVSFSWAVTPASGALTLTGAAPARGTDEDWVVSPDAGSVGVSGRVPNVSSGTTPFKRCVIVAAEDRNISIKPDDRNISIKPEDRVIRV